METGGRKLNKAVIVTKSTNFEPRAEIVGDFLKCRGVEVTYIYSDFSHREKKHLDRHEADHLYVDTYPYRKNLSWQRMWSQADFSRKAEKMLKGMDYDLLYVLIPGNVLVPMAVKAAEYQRKKSGNPVKLVIDIIDLWPESLRLGKLENIWPVSIWKKLRDSNLGKADLVITECDLYREKLGLDPKRSVTMYWGKKDTSAEWANQEVQGKQSGIGSSDNASEGMHPLQLAYLGAINNIIDIDGIVRLLKKLDREKPVLLHVIGDGENRETFLNALKAAGISYEYHGAVFDESEKHKILEQCSYGINMMKPGVCVGMTMKSIDYWSHGLPIINNIPGDTWKLCEEEGMGINVCAATADGKFHELKRNTQNTAIDRILKKELSDEIHKIQNRDNYRRRFTVESMEKVLNDSLMR